MLRCYQVSVKNIEFYVTFALSSVAKLNLANYDIHKCSTIILTIMKLYYTVNELLARYRKGNFWRVLLALFPPATICNVCRAV